MSRAERRRAAALARRDARRNARQAKNMQPKAGDVLLACEHKPDLLKGEILYNAEGFKVRGTDSKVQFLVMCTDCFARQKVEGIQTVLFKYTLVWGEGDVGVRFSEA